jgi:radical SAM protein with 4Fe4S-binding SPASM domain
MLTHNKAAIPETLEFLGQLGLKTIGLNALIYSGHGATVGTGLSESELQPILETAQSITNKYEQRLIWYTPTQYCNFDPVQMGLGVKGCTAALYNMCIEPNGDVIPCQSYYQSLGNILTQPWDKIWNHDLAISLRERHNLPEKCNDCTLLSECGGGCPLAAKVN